MRRLCPFLLLLTTSLLSQEVLPPDTLKRVPSLPWSATVFDRLDLRSHPSRTLEGIMTLSPGVTRASSMARSRAFSQSSSQPPTILPTAYSEIHVRGSREGETEYRFGGVSVLDRWTNANGVPFIPEMLENVTVHTGAYGAELGSMGGGVVEMKLREGGDTFMAEASYLTDDFAKLGEQFLNTSSYGWTTAVVVVGTPLPFDTRLFVAGEILRQANRQPMYLEPIDMVLAPDPYSSYYYPQGNPVSEPFRILRNHVPSQSAERSAIQWNLTSNTLGPEVSLFGSISSGRSRDIAWPTAVTNYFRQSRIPWIDQNSTMIAVRVTQEVGDRARVSGALSYMGRRSFTSDPDFGEQWRLYADSAANAAKGYLGFKRRYMGPDPYYAIWYFRFSHSSDPNISYRREASAVWSSQLKVDVAMSYDWNVSFGVEGEWWTLRSFSVGRINALQEYLDWNLDGIVDRTFMSIEQERSEVKRYGSVQSFGYTFYGNEVDDGPDGPRRPYVGSAFVQSGWTEGGFAASVGIRAQWFNVDMPALPNLPFPSTTDRPLLDLLDLNLYSFQPDKLVRTSAESYVLPRTSISYTTKNARWFGSYGTFAEVLPHQTIQLDEQVLAGLVHPYWRVPYSFGGSLVTYTVKASRTQQVELGGEGSLGKFISAWGTLYHKRMMSQVQMGRMYPAADTLGSPVVAFLNPGESSATGLELGVATRLLNPLYLSLTYAWSAAEGTGSWPRSNRLYMTDRYASPDVRIPPSTLRPLDFQRSHRFLAVVTVRPDDESSLGGLMLKAIVSMESGTPYTMELDRAFSCGCSSTPWNVGVSTLIDPRSIEPVEPLNDSRTPWISTVDLSVAYDLALGPVSVGVYTLVSNLFDTRSVLNIYPRTGSPSDDGWLRSQYSASYQALPQYTEFYRSINLQNRWAYMWATGNDIYGPPRQIRFGARVEW